MDESGDHNLRCVDPNFPVFCLAGCCFERSYYQNVVRPQVDAFKMRFWGTTDMILHSREIRKRQRAFSFLHDVHRRQAFYDACNKLIEELEFTILAVAILKRSLIGAYGPWAPHPYHLSLEFILERYSQMIRCRERTASKNGICADTWLPGQETHPHTLTTRISLPIIIPSAGYYER